MEWVACDTSYFSLLKKSSREDMFWSLSIFTAAAVAGSPHHPPLSYHISILVMKQFDQCTIYIPVTG